MKNLIFALILFLVLIFPRHTQAQSSNIESFKAKVVSVISEGTKRIGTSPKIFQNLKVLILEGEDKGKVIELEHGADFTITESQKVKTNDIIIVSKNKDDTNGNYRVSDAYRLDKLLFIFGVFVIIVLIVAGKKGFGSILGMLISIGVIFFFIVPQILNGANPLLISVFGSLFIMVTTIYLAHGFSQQTTIAVASTFISLLITIFTSVIFVKLMHLSGLGSEEMYSLLQGYEGKINFQGLLLGGIIIGTLGVLDDVTTTQTATVYTLSEANPKYTVKDLFQKGMLVGREHIASLVNTLVLAYAGAAIGVFIFLKIGLQNNNPLWLMLNSEPITEELIRAISGSLGLILAVPITTLLAAFFTKYSLRIK